MDSAASAPKSHPWWGEYTLDVDTGGRFDVGPSTVWVYRTAQNWRVAHRPWGGPEPPDPMVDRSGVTLPDPEADAEVLLDSEARDAADAVDVTRHSFRETEPGIALEPALADRPVVSRPEYPLYVPSGETVTLYLSTALWIRVTLPASGRQLQEVPSFRMSDTWFGPSTVKGTLCYATRTAGRLRRENLPRRRHRALTPLRVENRAADALALERVQLPAPHLALYETPDGALWTQAVEMTHTGETTGADVQVQDETPQEVADGTRIQDPRETADKRLFTSTFSAFGALFGS